VNARTPSPELAKHLWAIEEGNRRDREWMADERLDEIVFLCDVVASHSISALEAGRRGDKPLLGTHLLHAREGLMLALKTYKALPSEAASEGSAG
jgi:hypothetical protein